MKSARINFGIPDSEYILEVDDSGAATSLVNQDTNTEYVGGGGGDFSTAEVTFVINTEPGFNVYMPYLKEEEEFGEYYDTKIFDSGEYTAVLWKGYAVAYIVDNTGQQRFVTITVSGNAEVRENMVQITGDCTITLSQGQ